MVRGFYTAGSGILTSSRTLDMVAANMANSGTSGYKQDAAIISSFEQQLAYKLDGASGKKRTELGNISMGQMVNSIHTDFRQGTLQKTGNPLDIAISGEGFFTVQDVDGTLLYTRNGEFNIDEQGYIVTADGDRLMGVNGPVNTGGKLFEITPEGQISVEGQEIDRLLIYSPQTTNTFVKHREGYFYDTAAGNPGNFTGSILQGTKEMSNVTVTEEMMELMKSQKSLQSCSQAVKIINETLEQAIQLGRMG